MYYGFIHAAASKKCVAEDSSMKKDDLDVTAAAKVMSKLGASKGGVARKQSLTPEERREIARNAVMSRWARRHQDLKANDLPEATHSGELQIGETSIPCAVLEDGTRVLTRFGFLKAIGRTGKAKGGRQYDNEFQTPVFLTAENLQPFIPKDLNQNSTPILFIQKGIQSIGYRAELLPQVCQVFLDAYEAGVLKPNQRHIAHACRILYRGLATVGIIGLIDEATGFQEVRDRLALQEILDKFLLKEFAAWAKRFPDEFYQQIFRLRHWEWRGMKVNRPQIVAHYTKDFVYARLAPGILKELEARNPKDERGYRKAKHHMFFTDNIGHPALAQHLHAVVGLMRAADQWDQFQKMIDRAFPRRGDTLQLPLFKDDEFPMD
jgi:P63C domain